MRLRSHQGYNLHIHLPRATKLLYILLSARKAIPEPASQSIEALQCQTVCRNPHLKDSLHMSLVQGRRKDHTFVVRCGVLQCAHLQASASSDTCSSLSAASRFAPLTLYYRRSLNHGLQPMNGSCSCSWERRAPFDTSLSLDQSLLVPHISSRLNYHSHGQGRTREALSCVNCPRLAYSMQRLISRRLVRQLTE